MTLQNRKNNNEYVICSMKKSIYKTPTTITNPVSTMSVLCTSLGYGGEGGGIGGKAPARHGAAPLVQCKKGNLIEKHKGCQIIWQPLCFSVRADCRQVVESC